MTVQSTGSGPEQRIVAGGCPNAGSACFCVGLCRPIVVSKDDPRSDVEIREQRRRNYKYHASSLLPKEAPPCARE